MANELDAPDHGGEDAGPRRRGPRTSGDARASIIDAARMLFIESGADRVSARRIAAAAGVDPSLVRYYFGSLEALLEEALRPSEDLIAPYLRLRELPIEERGAALVAAALHTWEHPVGSTIMRWVTVSSDHDSAAYRRFAEAAPQHWMSALPDGIPEEEAAVRNSLVGAALGGHRHHALHLAERAHREHVPRDGRRPARARRAGVPHRPPAGRAGRRAAARGLTPTPAAG
ncbi:AcrR family transcriptional regulator [Clavibacter michiganensis]